MKYRLGITRPESPDFKGAYLDEDLVYQHIAVLGSSGRGKTTALLNLVNKFKDRGTFIILDPSGSLAIPARSILPNARLISKSMPMSLNPLTRSHLPKDILGLELVDIINTAVFAVTESVAITPKMRDIMLNALRISDDKVSISFLYDFLNLKLARDNYFNQPGKKRDMYWADFEMLREREAEEKRASAGRISDRLSLFSSVEDIKRFVIGKNEFDIPTLLNKGQHHIFNLKGLKEELGAMVGALVTNEVKSYYENQAIEKEAKPLFFVVDEISLFINPSLFGRFLSESRKYNICTILSAHNFEQMDKGLKSLVWNNTYTKIYLGGSAHDEAEYKKFYKYEIPDLKSKEAIIFIGRKPHYVRMFPPPDVPPLKDINFFSDGTDDWIFP